MSSARSGSDGLTHRQEGPRNQSKQASLEKYHKTKAKNSILTFAAFGGGCDTFRTRPKALVKDLESRTTNVPGGAWRSRVTASSRVIFGLYQYLDESLTNLKGKVAINLIVEIIIIIQSQRTWRVVERHPVVRCWRSRSRSCAAMCSKTLNHSDSLRGECADQCVSPCCGFECEEVKERREKNIKTRPQSPLSLIGHSFQLWGNY